MTDVDQTALEKFVVENDDLERLEALLDEFNIFEATGMISQELRHSDFLAFLLDPSQNHGLGDTFLKRFLKKVLAGVASPSITAIEVDAGDLHAAIVERERHHIDILIHDPVHRLVCVIENKITARELPGQLRKYHEVAAREFPGYRAVYVFLTPEGLLPSESVYIPLSYTEIANLVESICQARQSTLGTAVYTLMTHYVTMLRRHIVSESDVAELCRQIYRRHRRALDLIFEHRPDLQAELADLLKAFIASTGEQHPLALDDSVKSYVRFAVTAWDAYPTQKTAQGWTSSNRMLLFVFSNVNKSLQLGLFIGPGPASVRQAVLDVVQADRTVFTVAPVETYGGKWVRIYNRQVLHAKDYKDAGLEQLEEKLKREWEKFLAVDLPAIEEVIAGVQWPEEIQVSDVVTEE